MPTIVDSSGVVGEASALPGAPPIAGIAGDQQASLIGQGCTRPGMAKMTFGTGGMVDLNVGDVRPSFERRGPSGTFPIVAWRRGGRTTFGLEAFMLTAGQAVEWLRDDLGLISSSEESETIAAMCRTTGDVWFVPSLLGMGTPAWDFGARGTLVGLDQGIRPARDRPGRAGGRRPTGRRPGRRGRGRRRRLAADAAGRRGDERQQGLRPGPGRRHRPPHRGVAGEGGDHPGRRLPGRPGHRHVGRRGRDRGHLARRVGGRARSAAPTGTAGTRRATGPKAGSPS